jgi:class 3 adenylate cyclase
MTDDPDLAGAWIETEDGRRLPLRGNYRLGRAPDNHVIIDGAKASRHHAAIHVQDEKEFWLIDLGSRNGTFRNEQRVIRPTRLQDGDRIMLAGARFDFHQVGAGTVRPSTTSGGGATVVDFKETSTWLLIADMERFAELSQELPPDKLAMSVGRWIQESQRIVEMAGGRISKFLGDGFLACWESVGDDTTSVATTIRRLHTLREEGAIKFRVVVHYGTVTFGGPLHFGEENMIGSDLNYIFRLEALASDLALTYCASEPAESRLSRHLRTELVPGEHEMKGFPGRHRCYRVLWS